MVHFRCPNPNAQDGSENLLFPEPACLGNVHQHSGRDEKPRFLHSRAAHKARLEIGTGLSAAEEGQVLLPGLCDEAAHPVELALADDGALTYIHT